MVRRRYIRYSIYFVTMLCLYFVSESHLHAKGLLKNIRIQKLKERRYEVAFILRAKSQTQDIDKMHACMGRVDHSFYKKISLSKTFRLAQWKKKEHEYLNQCKPNSCKYNRFPLPVKKRLASAHSFQAKKQIYFQSLRDLTFKTNKRKSKNVVTWKQVKNEPCANHPMFRRLFEGKLPLSHVFWRKMSKEKRIRPTIQTFQVASWKAGNIRCIGRVLLFADNYYYDHLELVQLIPLPSKAIQMRVFVRSNFDFLDKWWAFILKGTLRRAVKKQAIIYVSDWNRRCS